jgi:REP element-mobilizing transposase RayT
MPRVARNTLPDGLFHVTGRGVARATIFRDGIDYAEFERQMFTVRDEYEWTLHAYCLLPNHYHLIVETSQRDLSAGMQRLNGRYAQRFNRRYDRVGHVFQNRFSSYVIESEDHFERALAYVNANAVQAGLCERVEDWPWIGGPSDLDVSQGLSLGHVLRAGGDRAALDG